MTTESNKKQSGYVPRVVVFACNWCSYAGADTAGINRFQYSPHVRLIRMMCSGRIHPAFVMRAFEKGADGVLITGCHLGDCHYISGNERAVDNFKILKELADLLGIDQKRIGLEWVSAAEGGRFGELMNEFIERVSQLGPMPKIPPRPEPMHDPAAISDAMHKAQAQLCFECGKCTGVCPVANVRGTFSPRQMTRSAALNGDGCGVLEDCLTCGLCDLRCPQEVDITSVMATLRAASGYNNDWGARPHGGIFQALGRIMSSPDLPVRHDAWVPEDARTDPESDTLLYVGCAPFHDAFFKELEVSNLDATRGALKILNHLDIEPQVLGNERCCGHDFYWSGDFDTFKRLAKINKELLEQSGAKRIVFTCPECRHTYQELYDRIGVKISAELVTMSEIISKNADKLNLQPQEQKVTFHDPCRLARHLGDIETPRESLRAVPSLDFREMVHSGYNSRCCGVSSWLVCDAVTKKMQASRLEEARAAGAEVLVTACPKCEIHLKCSLKSDEATDLKVRDLTAIVADALPGKAEEVAATAEQKQTN